MPASPTVARVPRQAIAIMEMFWCGAWVLASLSLRLRSDSEDLQRAANSSGADVRSGADFDVDAFEIGWRRGCVCL